MRRVRQRHRHDCGVAVVAILANVSYEIALDAVFPGRKKPRELRTTGQRLARALKKFGLRCDGKTKFLLGRSYRDLGHDAILIVDRNPDTWLWHWVVWDHKRRRVIDPYWRPKKRPSCFGYLAVYRD